MSQQVSFLCVKLWLPLNGEMISLPLSLAVENNREYKWLRQEFLPDLDVESAQVPELLRRFLMFFKQLVPVHIVLRGLYVDSVAHLHEFNDLRDQILGDARLNCYVSRVQVHVSTLDTLHAQGS